MTFSEDQLRVVRSVRRKQNLRESAVLADCLLAESGAGGVIDVIERLRSKKPDSGGPYAWSVSEEVEPFTAYFYSSEVSDFVGEDGTVDIMSALKSARELRFDGTVRITKELSRSGAVVTYTLHELEVKWQALIETKVGDAFLYKLKRPLTGFAPPTLRQAVPNLPV